MNWLLSSLLVVAAVVVGAARGVEPAPMPHVPALPIPFAAATELALIDAVRIGKDQAFQTRYLDARHLARQPEELAEHYAILSDHVNKISRGAEIVQPRKVTDWLWAVRCDDYEWVRSVFGDLARVNHYHLVPVKVNGEDTFAPMFGDNAQAFAKLVELTGSRTPIIRSDNFLRRTAIQAGEKGHGYYDFLQFKTLKDVEQFARLDRQGTIELGLERAEMVPASGVANPDVDRLILFAKSLKGWWLETRDAKTKKGQKNVTIQRLDDYKFDARMVIFPLPNDQPAGVLTDANGNLVDSAPDDIATDTGATNTDHRVHAGYSCWACHDRAGLKSFQPWARKVYRAATGAKFVTPDGIDPQLAKRQKIAYLADLTKFFKSQEQEYVDAAERASGLKPAELAAKWRRQWQRYFEPVTLAVAAEECGVTPEAFKRRLREYADPVPGDASKRRVIDDRLVALIMDEPLSMPRQYWEELFPVVMLILSGGNP